MQLVGSCLYDDSNKKLFFHLYAHLDKLDYITSNIARLY